MGDLNIKKLIVGADDWGYGPTATLTLVIKDLPENYLIDFVGKGIAYDFVKKNAARINRIYSNVDELDNEYDLAINVMDPTLAIWAYKRNIRIYSIDNLYWMWKWQDGDVEYANDIISNESSVDKIRKYLADKGEYLDYITMYLLSEKIFLQFFSKRVSPIVEQFNNKIVFIEPIVDNSFIKAHKESNTIVISFSGMKNPLIDERDVFVYLLYVKYILSDVIVKYNKCYKFIFTVKDEFVNITKRIFETDMVFSFNHNEFVDILKKTTLLFAPSGMTTTYESLLYDVPIIMLPEQHDSSYGNYEAFCSCANVDENEAKEIFPNLFIQDKECEFTTGDYYKFYIEDIMRSTCSAKCEILRKKAIEHAEVILNKTYTNRQGQVLKDVFGEYRGADTVRGHIELGT